MLHLLVDGPEGIFLVQPLLDFRILLPWVRNHAPLNVDVLAVPRDQDANALGEPLIVLMADGEVLRGARSHHFPVWVTAQLAFGGYENETAICWLVGEPIWLSELVLAHVA